VTLVKVAALLLAAGRGTRFGGDVPKVYLPLAGKAVLLHAAERLRQVVPAGGGPLVVVANAADRARHLAPLLPALDALGATVVDGGSTRQQSMQNGLQAAGSDCELVLVHDAARPLLPVNATLRCLDRAAAVGAALLAVPAADTLKRVGADGMVAATLDRSDVHCAQTPQVVRRELLVRALAHAARTAADATDDVGLVEAIGGAVAVVLGSPHNLKITGPGDLAIAAALLAARPEPT
jgi:2-C-methyl-D-erythritol 4-phosphate cytidylyltransferase